MAVHAGSWFGLPDFGVTEALAKALGNKQVTAQGGSNLIGSNKAQSTGQIQGVSNQVPKGQVQYPNPIGPTQNIGGGGGGYSAPAPTPTDGGFDFNSARENAQNTGNSALQAALGVFDARKQSVLNRIPGLQSARDLRIQGLDQDLSNFNTTADMELQKRLGGLQDEQGQINEQYVGAQRKTRASAKGLARNLRNLFGASGTLDSSQYRDMNIDQSKEVLQGIGDLNREKAGKITANTREQGQTQDYYSQQKLQEQKRVALEKEKTKAETDSLIQGVLDDANLTDAQKVEAVTSAQERLASRLQELDMRQADLTAQKQKDAQDYALKIAELSKKGQSSEYTQIKNSNEAVQSAAAMIQKLTEQGKELTPQEAANVFTQFGVDKDKASFYGQLYGGTASGGNDSFVSG